MAAWKKVVLTSSKFAQGGKLTLRVEFDGKPCKVWVQEEGPIGWAEFWGEGQLAEAMDELTEDLN